jgi:lysophospholipase L1-like esterase
VSLVVAGCGSSPAAPGPRPLALTCPANAEVSSPSGAAVPVTFALPATSGGSAPVNVTCAPASGAAFAFGSTTVACTATDGTGVSATCNFAVSVKAIPELTRTRFLTFGDSLTEGKISLTISMLVDSPSHSYPAKLARLLTERYTSQQPVVLNDGFGGELASASPGRLAEAIDDHRPEAILLMHGVNDLNSPATGIVQATVDAIEELTKRALQSGATTFVATLPPLGPGGKAGCPECVEPLNDRIRAMAAAKGAVLVDVHAAWGNRTGLMGADGIHPTEAGYQVIAEAFFEAIKKTLEKPAASP